MNVRVRAAATTLLVALFVALAGDGLAQSTRPSAEGGARLAREVDLRADRYVDAAVVATAPAGSAVEVLATEGGWVRVRVADRTGWVRGHAIAGSALPEVARVAAIESGRAQAANARLAVTAIRQLPKASRHALIVAIGDYGAAAPALPGVRADVESARQMATAMLVPDGNVVVVGDAAATRDGIAAAVRTLVLRMHGGERVFVYLAGHGTRARAADGGCDEGLLTRDGAVIGPTQLAALLKPVADRADKLLVLEDWGRAAAPVATVDGRPAAARFHAGGDCSASTPSLASTLAASGIPSANLVTIGAADVGAVALEHPREGGFATVAWRDCLLADARDADGSGSVSVRELVACAGEQLARRQRAVRGAPAPVPTVAGNLAFVPAWVGARPPAGSGATPPAPPPAAVLADIVAQADARHVVRATPSATRLGIGRDQLALGIESSRAGYVYVVLVGTDGSPPVLLFPNAIDADNRIAADRPFAIPRDSWRLTAGGPPGTNRVLVVVASTERDVAALPGDTLGPFARSLADANGRTALQWLLANGRGGAEEQCQRPDRRTLVVARRCDDGFGAALVEIEEVR